MALDQSALTDLLDALRSGGDLDFMREAMQLVLQALIDLEATQVIGAAHYERNDTRTTRNVLAKVPRGSAEMVAAAIRTVFAQPDAAAVADQLDSIAGKLGRQFPAVETMLREPAVVRRLPHRPLEEDLVDQPPGATEQRDQAPDQHGGHLPQRGRVLRLAGSILLEVHDEWQIAERRYLSEASMAKLYETDNDGSNTKEVGAKTKELLAG
jgi:putative transposase